MRHPRVGELYVLKDTFSFVRDPDYAMLYYRKGSTCLVLSLQDAKNLSLGSGWKIAKVLIRGDVVDIDFHGVLMGWAQMFDEVKP